MIDILEADGAASFDFIQGRVPVTPPPGFESYFGPGPHFRFLRDRGEAEASAVEGIRVFPEADTPEDALRALMPAGEAKIGFAGAREAALEQLYEALDADPEICGVVGYSEDGALALYNLFDDNMAIFFDSAGGHTIPRHGKLLQELAEAVKGLIANVHEDDSVQLPEPVKVAKRLDSAVNIPDLSALKLSHP
ncbi:unnamed protein product, partial [Aureobasidium pullulans]